jgi:hypothetical protein
MSGSVFGEKSHEETTYHAQDPDAAARLATVAERQVTMAEESWETYQTEYLPYEQEAIAANTRLIDINVDLMEAEFGMQERLLPEREETVKAGLEEMRRDIEAGRPVKDAQIENEIARLKAEGRLLPEQEEATRQMLKEAVAEMKRSAPAAEKFYKEAVEGVDPEERMGEATADVEQAFGQSMSEIRRELSRAGITPGSKKYQEVMADMIYQKAKGVGGARTRARRGAKAESFQRLTTAMGLKGRPTQLTAMPGRTDITSTAGGASGAVPYQQGVLQLGRLGDPSQAAANLMSGAAQTSKYGLTPRQESVRGSAYGGEGSYGF